MPEDSSHWNYICIVINLDIFNEITKANITNDVQSTKPISTVFPGDRKCPPKGYFPAILYIIVNGFKDHISTHDLLCCEIYGNFVEFTEMENITCCTQKYRSNPALSKQHG